MEEVQDVKIMAHMTKTQVKVEKQILPMQHKNTIVDKEGTINLGKGPVLRNVLYMPNLACNLISISQLIHDSNCVVTFSNKLCVIHDHTSRIMIGWMNNGMRRLGHPSSQIVSLLPSIHVGKKDKHEQVCDICLKAKQIRDISISSQNKANECFNLINCDCHNCDCDGDDEK
ncbi:hypothetical protein CR513_11055, partial [Mucuna pruriens]